MQVGWEIFCNFEVMCALIIGNVASINRFTRVERELGLDYHSSWASVKRKLRRELIRK